MTIYDCRKREGISLVALDSAQGLAENVKGVVVPLSGHYIPEERPDFLIKELMKFFNE